MTKMRHNGRQHSTESAIRSPKVVVVGLGSSFLLVLLAVLGFSLAPSYVWPGRLLNHPFVFACLAAAILGASLTAAVRWLWLRIVIAIVTTLTVLAGVLVGGLISYLSSAPVVKVIPAPDGNAYEAVVRRGSDGIDPVWYVYTRETTGLRAQQWLVGCLSGDNPEDGFRSLRWRDAQHLIVNTWRQTMIVKINASTGKPESDGGGRSCSM